MSLIDLSGECTIYEIAHIHQQVHENWKAGTDLEIDVSAVTNVDASFVQLLASCRKQAEKNKHVFSILNANDILNEKLKTMFMVDYFADEAVQS